MLYDLLDRLARAFGDITAFDQATASLSMSSPSALPDRAPRAIDALRLKGVAKTFVD
jgi:hypothetical protein